MKNFSLNFVMNDEKKQYEVELKNEQNIPAKPGEYSEEFINVVICITNIICDYYDKKRGLKSSKKTKVV